MRSKLYLCSWYLLIGFACATNNSQRPTSIPNSGSAEVLFLPGVDSAVAKNALQFSDRILVDFNRQSQADLWYKKAINSAQLADSLWITAKVKNELDSFRIQFLLNWRIEHEVTELPTQMLINLKSDKINVICLIILNQAANEASQAKLLDPFNLDIRSLLVKISMKQGEVSKELAYYERAIEELNKFLLVDKSNPFIYEKLGECYYALRDWEKCYLNFHQAEQILKIISGFKLDTSHWDNSNIDTTRWVYYLNRQGEARAKMYDADQALYYLSKAKELADSDVTKHKLQQFLNWINWDGGNIRAAELKDYVQELEKSGDYKKSRNKYLELLNILITQPARNEINWKIASIDYNFLGRKKEALERLFHVIKNITRAKQSSPLDTVYLKDYAAMCYSVGIEYVKQNNYRFAYIYINQAAQFDWQHKGNCYFQLALLSHQNPDETIRNCEKALIYSSQLPTEVIRKLEEMLAVSYQRKGEFETAQRYTR